MAQAVKLWVQIPVPPKKKKKGYDHVITKMEE
jgi:hypothetical protein